MLICKRHNRGPVRVSGLAVAAAVDEINLAKAGRESNTTELFLPP
jgi:hypothetical protein